MQRIELHLRIRIIAGRRAELLAFLQEAIPFYESPGGITIRLLQDDKDECRFIEVVEYQDQLAYERDQLRVANDPTMKMYLDRWRQMLVEPPVVEVFRRVAL